MIALSRPSLSGHATGDIHPQPLVPPTSAAGA